MAPTRLSCFKAYDIRGRLPDELNEDIAYRLGVAYAERYRPRRVAIGRDVRRSGRALQEALALGLEARGTEVLDLGLAGTEEVYFATVRGALDGGFAVTASHNPPDYNGFKLVRAGAQPVSADSGLRELETAVAASDARRPGAAPRMIAAGFRPDYVRQLLGWMDPATLKALTIVVDSGNGCAGPVVDALAPHLPFRLVRVRHEPDGGFPNGVPNPLLPENRATTAEAVLRHRADLGVAWDGDFDRCFLFDEAGRFVEGYYIVGLLAEALLARHPAERIVHDPRLTWNTIEVVRAAGGVPVQCRSGHAFMKECLRRENALYGGEMSAHHYFRDFAFCDSGMIPWLLVASLICARGAPLSELVGARMRRFPVSGEINRQVARPAEVLRLVESRCAPGGRIEHGDGLSVEYPDWRFNLRASNTEPLLRLNVEARGDAALVENRTRELLSWIDAP